MFAFAESSLTVGAISKCKTKATEGHFTYPARHGLPIGDLGTVGVVAVKGSVISTLPHRRFLAGRAVRPKDKGGGSHSCKKLHFLLLEFFFCQNPLVTQDRKLLDHGEYIVSFFARAWRR